MIISDLTLNSFIDAEDSPPTSCGVSLPRDCTGTCIVTAITNYVGLLLEKSCDIKIEVKA